MKRSVMTGMISMLANVTPEHEILDELSLRISRYKIDPTPKNKAEMLFQASMLLHKQVVSKMGVVAFMDEFEKMSKARDLLKTKPSN